IQIAKARGARVIATASGVNQDLLKQLGADVAIDYTQPNWESAVHDVDLALVPVGGEAMRRTYGVVKKGGIVISIAARYDETELKKHEIRRAFLSSPPNPDELAEITPLNA